MGRKRKEKKEKERGEKRKKRRSKKGADRWGKLYYSIKELRSRSEEMFKGLNELKERVDKTSEGLDKFKESVKVMTSELKERVDKTSEGLDKFKESVKVMTSELKERVDKTSEGLDKFKESVKGITNGWGRFVEGLVEPSCLKFLEKKGFKVIRTQQRIKASKEGRSIEYDIFVICEDKKIFVVSAKTFFSSRDVDELLKDLKDFFFFFDEYREYEVFGACAGISFGRGAEVYARRKGFYVFVPSGDLMVALEPRKLKVFRFSKK